MCIPSGLALDASGTLYISFGFSGIDSLHGDFRIRKVDNNGVISTFAGGGTPQRGASIPDGARATAAPFYIAHIAAGDAAGNLFFTDGARVRKITPSGIVSTVAGTGERAFSGDGGPAISAKLGLVSGIAADKAGNVFISEFSNNRVRIVGRNYQHYCRQRNGRFQRRWRGRGGSPTNGLRGPGCRRPGQYFHLGERNHDRQAAMDTAHSKGKQGWRHLYGLFEEG
jgi:hypothetical protein